MSPKTILVTGSAQGIGAAIAKTLANSGHNVIGVDIKKQEEDHDIYTICADLSKASDCELIFRDISAIDILVNNAAILIEKPIPDISLEEFDLTIAVNLRSLFLLSRLAVGNMATRHWGRIVNVSSVGARTGGLSDSAVYSSTKAAIISLTKSFARKYGQYGINTNAIAPGGIETPMVRQQFENDPGLYKRIIDQIPLHRLGAPDEVASVVKFLCSDDASFINGVTIDVNGGWILP